MCDSLFCSYLLSHTFYAVLLWIHFCRNLHTFSGKILTTFFYIVGTEGLIDMNLKPLSYFFMLFNWIPSMFMLITPMAIAKMAKMAILAVMATILMANINFSMALRGIFLIATKKKLSDIGFIWIGPFDRRYRKNCDFIIFTQVV